VSLRQVTVWLCMSVALVALLPAVTLLGNPALGVERTIIRLEGVLSAIGLTSSPRRVEYTAALPCNVMLVVLVAALPRQQTSTAIISAVIILKVYQNLGTEFSMMPSPEHLPLKEEVSLSHAAS